jgi:hypothetical protein
VPGLSLFSHKMWFIVAPIHTAVSTFSSTFLECYFTFPYKILCKPSVSLGLYQSSIYK